MDIIWFYELFVISEIIRVIINIKDAIEFIVFTGVGPKQINSVNVFLTYRYLDIEVTTRVQSNDLVSYNENEVFDVLVTQDNYSYYSETVAYDVCEKLLEFLLPFHSNRNTAVNSVEIVLVDWSEPK